MESFVLLDGAPAAKDIMDGIDTTWARVPGGEDVGRLADEVISGFDVNHPAASVAGVLAIRTKLAKIEPGDPIIDEKRRLLDRILQGCAGLRVRTTMADAEVVPGETMKLQHTAQIDGDMPVKWVGVRYPTATQEIQEDKTLQKGQAAEQECSVMLPANTPVSQPYWLREEPGAGMYKVADPSLIGRPENPPAFPVEFVFEIGGQTLVIPDQPVQILSRGTEAERGKVREERLQVIPPVTMTFGFDVRLIPPGARKPVAVEVKAARAGINGTLQLQAPAGWTVEPASAPFSLKNVGDHANSEFLVTAPAAG